MLYTPPNTVIAPQDCVSNIHVIFDGGVDSYSVVKLDWNGSPRIAMRWNVSEREWHETDKASGSVECKGMPTSHGVPVWFVLPDDFLDTSADVWKDIAATAKKFGIGQE